MQIGEARTLAGGILLALVLPLAVSAETPKVPLPTLSEQAHWELIGIYRPDFEALSPLTRRPKARRISWKYDHPMQLAGSDVVLRLKASAKLRKAVRLELKF
jgi:hypothetical protein